MKTPQQSYPALAKALGLREIYLKREDLHHFGSHKGRSIPIMMEQYHRKNGAREFVISSSGNAALAAMLFTISHNLNNPKDMITLKVLIGKKISLDKLKLLTRQAKKDASITFQQVHNPRQQAFLTSQNSNMQLLRLSTDDIALVGYQELAKELERIPNLSAVFVPTSSGTTAQGLAQTFSKLNTPPQVHIVQTTSCHNIATALDAELPADDNADSLADAIVDKVAARKTSLVCEIKKTGGTGWIVNNDEINKTIDLVKQTTGILISPNSALSVAGLAQAIGRGSSFAGVVACLITGR